MKADHSDDQTPTITFKREDILLVPDLEYDSLAISFPVMKAVSERLGLKWMPSEPPAAQDVPPAD